MEYRALTGGSVTSSPDGTVLIAEVQGVLWRVPPEGGTAQRLTDWQLEATRPAVSPDGTRLAVGGYQGGGFHLWTLRTDGSGLRRVTDGPWDDRGVAWSPDGTRLVFSSERWGDAVAGAPFGLWTVGADGGRPVRLTGGAFEDLDPAWWPDGRSVVCVRAAHTADGGTDGGLTLVRVPVGGGPEQVVHRVREGAAAVPLGVALRPDRLAAPVRNHVLPAPSARADRAPGRRPPPDRRRGSGGGPAVLARGRPDPVRGRRPDPYPCPRPTRLGAGPSLHRAHARDPPPLAPPNSPPWTPPGRCAASTCPPCRPTETAWPSSR
ncbi:hypothetical protein LT493_04280 [Streptomyces tricolor]|nr:hypothetical protein [Streptomyces tricolor]